MTDSTRPTFSIIIPTYNNVELFARAVQSVISQSFDNWKVIVTDDSKTPVIEDYILTLDDPRIEYHRRLVHDGAVANWNNGLSLANGQHIIIMHHDEELIDRDYLRRLTLKLRQADLIVSDIRVCMPGQSERRGRVNGWIKRLMLAWPASVINTNPIGPCACLAFKRELLQPFDENLTWIVDTEWYYRMLKSSPRTLYAPDLIIRSNSGHADQITLNIDIAEKDRQDTIYLRKKYHDYYAVRLSLGLKKITSKLRKLLKR